MPASKVEICNMALKHLGVSVPIGNLTTERSEAADSARSFFDICTDTVLRAFNWPFATTTAALSLISDPAVAYSDEWFYEYQYPSDCVYLRKIDSGTDEDTLGTVVKYMLGDTTQGTHVLTNMQEATAEYTKRISDVTRWPADFTMAFSYLLASMMASSFTRGDVFKKADSMAQKYLGWVGIARKNAANEEKRHTVNQDADLVRARL